METDKYLQDIQDIKKLMTESSQFISLSGLAGILAGIYALMGGIVVHFLIVNHDSRYITLESLTFKLIVVVATLVLFFSVVTAFFLTLRKAKRNKETIWNPSSKKLLFNFLIPLVTGGIFSLLLIKNGYYGLIAPVTLLFYGLSCLNASKYTYRDVRYLGITELILGLLAVEFSGYGLYFWVLGFGICHIVYGTLMYVKYDKN